jgi:hypothetical protein
MLALLGVVLVVAAAASTASSARTAPSSASARCTNGVSDRIARKVVCIHAGGRCLAAHNAKYRAHGFTCVNGRLRRLKKVSISIADASVSEGNAGSTTVSVPVALSAASPLAVSVGWATADGTAASGSDYTAASGRLTFAPGETQKTIAVTVAGDTVIEADETLTVQLSAPVNATIGQGSATVAIQNDDAAAAITAGSYQGLAGNGSYVFFTVTPDRGITALRFNDLTEICNGGAATLPGGSDFGTNVAHIDSAGGFHASGTWSGSQRNGDIEYTYWSADVVGHFTSPTAVTGTITEKYELNYQGAHYSCSSGQVTWSAARQG